MTLNRLVDYCASKYGITGFTDALRVELYTLGQTGIGISLIAPAAVNTRLFAGYQNPRFTPRLEPSYVAERIVQAIQLNETEVFVPRMIRVALLLKALAPTKFGLWLGGVLGTFKTMDNFHGRSGS